MRWLHLVRHAPVKMDPDVMASDWELASDGEASILAILDSVEASRLERIVTSQEVKAKQTGELLAAHLGLPLETRPGLEEHHRGQADFLNEAGFKAALASFFSWPNEVVFGEESAAMSFNRFAAAIREMMNETNHDELVVSHGRVISLFVASLQRADPMEVWSSLKLPDHIPIEWPIHQSSAEDCAG